MSFNEFIRLSGKIKMNAVFAAVATTAVFFPDFIMNSLAETHIVWEPLFCFYLFCFMFLLSFCQKIFVYAVLGVFILMELVQLNFMAYFGHPLTASEIMNIFYERKDIFDTAYLRQTWFVTPLIVLSYGFVLFVFYKWGKRSVKMRFMFLAVLYLMSHKPYRALSETKGIWYFQPGPTRSSLKNSINTFSYFFFQYLWKDVESSEIVYLPYSVENSASSTQNVLLIFGESLYGRHLPFYGYGRNTFPQVAKALDEFPNKTVSLAVSSGISTATSTVLFFNTVREPANIGEIRRKTGNLFAAAKANGFETYYYSNQESRLLLNLGEEFIDHIANNDSEPRLFGKYKDEGLVKLLEEIDFTKGKKFVVLHMRSPHSPYENRYKGREREFEKFTPAAESKNRLEYTTNTYDNALLYTDMVIAKMIKTFGVAAKKTNFSVFFTADHGQLFDYQGMWGHNNLTGEQGIVPAVVIGNDAENLPEMQSAYEFGKHVLKALGTKLLNPNEKDNTFYLHGNNIYYPYDFIEYKISEEGEILERKPQNTRELKDNQ